jgi:hypothetical protein
LDVQDRQIDVLSDNLVSNVVASSPVNLAMTIGDKDNILDELEMFAVFHDDVDTYNQR